MTLLFICYVSAGLNLPGFLVQIQQLTLSAQASLQF